MDEWVDAVEKHGKTISLSEIEIDEDLLNAVQKQQLQHKDLDSWIIRKEDVQEFYEWMPVHVHMPGNEIRIYCVNVWKSSSKFKTFICVRALGMDAVEVDERPDIKQDWIIEQLNGEVNVYS